MEQAAGLPEETMILPWAMILGHITHLADSHNSAVNNSILIESGHTQGAGFLSVCWAITQDLPWEHVRNSSPQKPKYGDSWSVNLVWEQASQMILIPCLAW